MNFIGHTLVILVFCGILMYFNIIPFSGWIIIPAIVMSTLIDADWKLPLVKHRGITHTFIFIAIIALIAYLITNGTGHQYDVLIGIFIGGFTHLVADNI